MAAASLRKRALKALGLALAAAALLWLGWRGASADWSALEAAAPGAALAAALLGAAWFALLGAGLAWAWRRTLIALGASRAQTGGQARAHALSQPLKYLPGNVGHLALRHALGRRRGLGHGPLARAALAEAGLAAGAAGLLAVALGGAALAVSGQEVAGLSAKAPAPLAVAMVLALAGTGAAVWGLRRFAALRALAPLLPVWLGYFALSGAGGLLFWLWLAPGETTAALALALPAAMAAAWLAGFVTPGAPGGLGVREAVLLALLGGSAFAGAAGPADPAAVIALALWWRVAGAGGDALLALLALQLRAPDAPAHSLSPAREAAA